MNIPALLASLSGRPVLGSWAEARFGRALNLLRMPTYSLSQ